MSGAPSAQSVEEAVKEARRQWPGVDVPGELFAEHVEARAQARHLTDLYLAFACARGDHAALGILDRDYLAHLDRAILGVGIQPGDVDDVRQRLRVRLLVDGANAPAKILAYTGTGPLSAWLRVCVVREAVNTLRAEKRPRDTAAAMIDCLAATDEDLERIVVKNEARDVVRKAFAEAVAELPTREANVLRYRVLDGLTSNEIARLYGVHRATTDRWLAGAKERVLRSTRARLSLALGLDRARAQSLIEMVTSRLDLSLSVVFEGA